MEGDRPAPFMVKRSGWAQAAQSHGVQQNWQRLDLCRVCLVSCSLDVALSAVSYPLWHLKTREQVLGSSAAQHCRELWRAQRRQPRMARAFSRRATLTIMSASKSLADPLGSRRRYSRPACRRGSGAMSLAQGWFHSGVLLWPLWCPPDPPCPQHCVATFSCWPFVALHLAIFYGSAGCIHLLRRRGKWPSHTGFDASFDDTFYIAWHIPMMVMAIPMGLMALSGARDVWATGDRFIEYGYITDPLVAEAGTWFVCFISVDTVLLVVHKLGGQDTL
ncbi:unnamed protein product [Effrenium voratum]|nr:unnamed protein product [Effrenium voratum]